MVTYYLKFLLNLADTLSPLYALLGKGAKWSWSKGLFTLANLSEFNAHPMRIGRVHIAPRRMCIN